MDNQALVACWGTERCASPQVIEIMKDIFQVCFDYNIHLSLFYIPSRENPADAPSRQLAKGDATLTPRAWELVQQVFGGVGGHTLDLMALDSNAMVSREGTRLRHFTPQASPGTSGVNVFSQQIRSEERCYAFPPIYLIPAVIAFLQERQLYCTLVVPAIVPAPAWLPRLMSFAGRSMVIGYKGDKGVLLYPSAQGYQQDKRGLPWNLCAVSIGVESGALQGLSAVSTIYSHPPCLPSVWCLGDSMVRFLHQAKLSRPSLSSLHLLSISGGTIGQVCQALRHCLSQSTPRLLVIHVGTNAVNKFYASESSLLHTALGDMHRLLTYIYEAACDHSFAVVLSGIVPMPSPVFRARFAILNQEWASVCERRHWRFVSHDNIDPQLHLADGIHLNDAGKRVFLSNFQGLL